MPEWINRRSRIYWYDQYALNVQATAFAKYDPDRIVRELLDTGADIFTIYAANQFGIAYYPSAVVPQHPNLCGQDYVRDLMSRLHDRNRKVILYINWLDSMHPEWRVRPPGTEDDPDPDPPLASWASSSRPEWTPRDLKGGQWLTPCINSPRRDQIKGVVREILERYRPDGLHLDMFFNSNICLCEYCRPQVARICGTNELTRDVVEANWPTYIDWRCDRSAAFIGEVTAMIREKGVVAAHNAFCPLYMNSYSGVSQDWLPHLDIYLSECFDAFSAPWSDLNATSLTVRWQHAVAKPAWILRTSHPLYYAHWPITKAQWELYAAACKANGCKVFGPCGVAARPDTTSAPSLLENVKHGLERFMQDADLDDGAESAAKIALVYSWRTRRYCPPSREDRWAAAFAGWGRLLIEEHLPFDVVVAEDIGDADALGKYDLAILPNTNCLGDAFCKALSNYVHCGGRILATGQCSLLDDRAKRRSDFALRDVLGIRHEASVDESMAIEWEGDAAPAYGLFEHVHLSNGTKVVMHGVHTDPSGSVLSASNRDPLPMERSAWPICTLNHHGDGGAMYVSFAVGEYFSQHGDQHIGQLMATLIDRLLPSRQIEVQAPRTLEVTLWRQTVPAERIIIHLANRTVPWSMPTKQRQFTEIVPLHDVQIRMRQPFGNPQVSARQAQVTSKVNDRLLRIDVHRVDAYAAIVIERS